MPDLVDVEQGSQAWLDLRAGKATASRFKDVLATLRNGGESASRRNYRAELVVERLTGQSPERYTNQFMTFGSETEGLARVEYSLKTGRIVEEVGFVPHPELQAGASPDGFVGKDGGIEIKCRQIALHIQALKTDEVPAEYIPQIDGNLWMSGREWWDFVSFAPELSENAQLFIKRVYRDDERISKLALEVAKFLNEVDSDVAFVKGYKK